MAESKIDHLIEGTYFNIVLGSVMEIKEAKDGYIKGCYKSKVGTKYEYPLVGQYDIVNGNSLGWVVTYHRADSTCAWSGQIYTQANGIICIHTTWLLSAKSTDGDLWHSTNVGVDIFNKVDPGDLASCKLTEPSHPRQSNIPNSVLMKEKESS